MEDIKNSKTISFIEKFLFSSRWLLAILYAGLCSALLLYTYKFGIELWHMIYSIQEMSSEHTMLALLGLVDISMVANLVTMIVIGGYSIFIREINPHVIENRPRFMNHITASGLKVKMTSSLMGISSIHLLKKFIESAESSADTLNWTKIGILLAIHGMFVVSTVALSYIDRPHNNKGEKSHA